MFDRTSYRLAHLALCLLIVGMALGAMLHGGSWHIPGPPPGVAQVAAFIGVTL